MVLALAGDSTTTSFMSFPYAYAYRVVAADRGRQATRFGEGEDGLSADRAWAAGAGNCIRGDRAAAFGMARPGAAARPGGRLPARRGPWVDRRADPARRDRRF